MSDNHNTIDDLMLENRKFPPSDEFKRQALVAGTSMYDEADEDYEGFWAKPGGRAAHVDARTGHDLRVGAAVRQVVRRRPAQRQLQLPRPPRRRRQGRQGGVPLGG